MGPGEVRVAELGRRICPAASRVRTHAQTACEILHHVGPEHVCDCFRRKAVRLVSGVHVAYRPGRSFPDGIQVIARNVDVDGEDFACELAVLRVAEDVLALAGADCYAADHRVFRMEGSV